METITKIIVLDSIVCCKVKYIYISRLHYENIVGVYIDSRRRHGTEVVLVLLTQQPQVRFLAFPNKKFLILFCGKFISKIINLMLQMFIKSLAA